MSTHDPTQRDRQRLRDDGAHALPRWVNFIQDNLFLTFLILAEAYLLGTLMTLGWVGDIEQPEQWGAYHGLGVVLFFFAGAMAAGVALRCSVAAANAFKRRDLGFGLFNFLGLLVFSGAEIWASLSERSANLRPTPADTAVLNLLGVSSLPVSPTVVVVALLLPFASLYYGFSQQRVRESEQDRADNLAQEEAALERKVLRAKKMAEVRTAQAAGLAGAMRAGVQAARGKRDATEAEEASPSALGSAGDRAAEGDAEDDHEVAPAEESEGESEGESEETMPTNRYNAKRLDDRLAATR